MADGCAVGCVFPVPVNLFVRVNFYSLVALKLEKPHPFDVNLRKNKYLNTFRGLDRSLIVRPVGDILFQGKFGFYFFYSCSHWWEKPIEDYPAN